MSSTVGSFVNGKQYLTKFSYNTQLAPNFNKTLIDGNKPLDFEFWNAYLVIYLSFFSACPAIFFWDSRQNTYYSNSMTER